MSPAAIWLEDRDTQLSADVPEVLITLVRVTVCGEAELSWTVSLSVILILLTISPYSLLSISASAVAVDPSGLVGASIVTDGCVVYPLPPVYPLLKYNSTVTT